MPEYKNLKAWRKQEEEESRNRKQKAGTGKQKAGTGKQKESRVKVKTIILGSFSAEDLELLRNFFERERFDHVPFFELGKVFQADTAFLTVSNFTCFIFETTK